MEIISNHLSDKGLWKEKNQDSLCIKIARTPIGLILMAVLCDGMGGLNNGEIASALAVETYGEWFETKLSTVLQPFSLEVLKNELLEQMEKANERIIAYGCTRGIRLGTTCSVLLLIDQYFYILIHIGDTRVYELREEIKLLTRDHTLVEREIILGHLTPKEAEKDNRHNILLQCLGDRKVIHPDIQVGEVKLDSVYLLCSDGFYRRTTHMELSRLLPVKIQTEEDICATIKQLTLQCREKKEKDDITAIGIKITT